MCSEKIIKENLQKVADVNKYLHPEEGTVEQWFPSNAAPSLPRLCFYTLLLLFVIVQLDLYSDTTVAAVMVHQHCDMIF